MVEQQKLNLEFLLFNSMLVLGLLDLDACFALISFVLLACVACFALLT